MCALQAAKCERRWWQPKKKKTGFASSLSPFLPLPPRTFSHSHNHFCLLRISLDKLGKETARNLARYLCAHHSQHCDLVLEQTKTDYGNIIRIVLPFKDQIAANAACRQLRDLNVYINILLG